MSVVFITTTRKDGDLRPLAALAKWLASHHWPTPVAMGVQVHDIRLQTVSTLLEATVYRRTDGFLTSAIDQPIGIFTADCLPVFISDEKKGVVGALHAGWRGVRAGILKKAVRTMRKKWGSRAADIRVWFGPCIQGCCFKVQWDVAKHFPLTRRRWQDRWRVDLVQEMRRQAARLGLREARQNSRAACTMHTRRYFSFRQNKTPNRQISLIMRTRR